MRKVYRIADLCIEMDASGKTERQAEKYVAEDMGIPVQIYITPDRERTRTVFPTLSEDDVEYMSTGTSFHRQILKYDGMMLHSSAVVMHQKAYLFAAPCGTGKSTHTALWKRVFGDDNALILNDDKPIVRCLDGIWYAYGTPWSGKTNQNLNMRAPIAGICILSRGETNRIKRCFGVEAIQLLLMQIPKPKDAASRAKILELLDKLLADVPVWKMECNMELDAPIVSYEAMSGESMVVK